MLVFKPDDQVISCHIFVLRKCMEEATKADVVFHKPHLIKPFWVCAVCKDPDVVSVPLLFRPPKLLATDPLISQTQTCQTTHFLVVKSHSAFLKITNKLIPISE